MLLQRKYLQSVLASLPLTHWLTATSGKLIFVASNLCFIWVNSCADAHLPTHTGTYIHATYKVTCHSDVSMVILTCGTVLHGAPCAYWRVTRMQQRQQRQQNTSNNTEQRPLRCCAPICYAWQSVSVEAKRWNDQIVGVRSDRATNNNSSMQPQCTHIHENLSCDYGWRAVTVTCRNAKLQPIKNSMAPASSKIVATTTKSTTKNANCNRTSCGMLQLTAVAKTTPTTTVCAIRVRKHDGGWLIDMRNLLASPACCHVFPPPLSIHATHIHTLAYILGWTAMFIVFFYCHYMRSIVVASTRLLLVSEFDFWLATMALWHCGIVTATSVWHKRNAFCGFLRWWSCSSVGWEHTWCQYSKWFSFTDSVGNYPCDIP